MYYFSFAICISCQLCSFVGVFFTVSFDHLCLLHHGYHETMKLYLSYFRYPFYTCAQINLHQVTDPK